MMKHESVTKPLAIVGGGGEFESEHMSRSSGGIFTPPLKRRLWGGRSTSEAPPSNRSPITKAFDFLPWSRTKKPSVEKLNTAAAAAAAAAASDGKEATNGAVTPATEEQQRKEVLHYHRNIFRSGGGLIRDILGDKLNKDKTNNNQSLQNSNSNSNNGSPVVGGQKGKQRRPRQVVARNKSLDIKELINCVEQDLRAGKQLKGDATPQRFLDDTFIENLMRAKHAYQQNYTEEQDYYAAEEEHSPKAPVGNSSPKHILFNDENIVYLIKKELPVKRETSRNKRQQPPTTAPMRSSSGDKLNLGGGESILRARLKFKKLMPETGGSTPTLNNHAALMAPVKRSILHRQNTSPPTAPASNCAMNAGFHATSPELGGGRDVRRQQQLYQRANAPHQLQRRKSLTDGYENAHYDHSSSSSSMGSGGGIIVERPKTDKPRKKLSFREPIVASEKGRVRRRSSPLQRPRGLPNDMINNNVITNSNNNNNNNNNHMNHNQNCENSMRNATGVQDSESQAMRIVRTVGQAFEVCHKFNLHKNSLDHNNDEQRSDVSSELLDVEHITDQHHQTAQLLGDIDEANKKDQLSAATPNDSATVAERQRPNHLELVPQSHSLNHMRKSPNLLMDDDKSPTTPTSPSREILKLKDQLEAQALQTRQALAQLMLVREQLISETNARIEAQARTQQLLQQNRELLEHLASLGAYSEQQQQQTGLTSANIALAPQSQLQMLLQATAAASNNNNNLASINQQLSNLGTINQQLTSLSHQLSGLNQQSANLQSYQSIGATLQQQHQQQQQQQQQLTPPTSSSAALHQSQLHLNIGASTPNANGGGGGGGGSNGTPLSTSPYPSMQQLQSISSHLQQHSHQQQQQQQQQDVLSKDLFHVNQELLNRLQALNLGSGGTTASALALPPSSVGGAQTPSPHNSFFFANPMSSLAACSPANNNNHLSNYNYLSAPSSMGNLTPSPLGTLSRNSYSNSPINEEMRLSLDKNLNALDEQLMKPLHLSAGASNGNLAAGGSSAGGTRDNSRSSSTLDSPSSPCMRGSNEGAPGARFNTVMLKVTDESGNVTNQRKLSATPSFITRSTSEKVPNRSQMMSQVQRTAWARHTTK